MAGFYADVPSWRMAYDVDGTQVFTMGRDYTSVTQANSATISATNDENITEGGLGLGSGYAVFIFPELRDLDAWFCRTAGLVGELESAQVSSDTTNGIDGIWTSVPTFHYRDATLPQTRTAIGSSTALGIKAIRFLGNVSGYTSLYVVNLYGEPAPGENLQRLEIWHPTLDQRVDPAYFDWGDVPRNTVETRSFRIKNLHGSLTANGVRAAMSILTDTAPSVVGQMAISKDGSTWAAQQTLTSPLAAEEISPVLQIRRTTPSNAVLSLWWYRLFADCTSWS